MIVNSAVFQAGGLVVVLVEVTRKSYLASLVPVIVNAVLNDHQIVIDIVAFVSYGDFPRSRLGEKQRGKILGSWVTRKMRTIAQFSIRDADGAYPQMLQSRMSRGSKTGSIMGGSSLRKSTLVPDSDSSTRVAPAPVQERRELVDEPYMMQEDEEEKHYQELLNDPQYGANNDGSREIQEQSAPQPLAIDTHQGYEREKNPTPVLSPDDGFDFGESFGQRGYNEGLRVHEASPPRNVPSVAIAPPSTSGSQDSRVSHASPPRGPQNDRDILPSQQKQYNIAPQVTSPTEDQSWLDTSRRPISTEDWPQEALLYQSHYDTQGSSGHPGRDSGNFNAF